MRRPRGEQGVVAIVMALITCAVLIPMGAFAVDIGMQRVARRDMQSLADVVSLDLARHLDGQRTAGEWASAVPSLQELANKSRDRNRATLGGTAALTPTLGFLDVDGKFTTCTQASPPVAPAPTGCPAQMDSSKVPNAIRVVTDTSVGFAFASGSGGVTRTAVAQAQKSACFQLGSFAASINPASSALFRTMLGPLLGSSTMNLVGYNGLASANLSLLDLIKSPHIGVGTVSELLAMDDLTVGDLYLASADVLQAQGKPAQAQVFQSAAGSVVASIVIQAADLFGLTTATDAVLSTQFNALDLLIGSAFLADGDHLVGIPNLQAGLSSVGVTNTDLSIIERPQRACGTDEAKTAQVKLTSTAKLSLAIPLLSTVNATLKLIDSTGSPSGDVTLALDTFLAGAHGHLTNVSCSPDIFDADIWSDLVKLSLSGTAHLEGSVKVDLTVLGVPIAGVSVPVTLDIGVTADGSRSAAAGPVNGHLAIPPSTYQDHTEVGGGGAALPHVTVGILPNSLQVGNVTVKVGLVDVAVPTATLLGAVTPVLTPLIQELGSTTGTIGSLVNPLIDKVNAIISQLSEGMGLNLPGADMFDLPTPICNAPVLRG